MPSSPFTNDDEETVPIGRFTIRGVERGGNGARLDPAVLAIFARCIVLRADFNYARMGTEYVAYSEQFKPVAKGPISFFDNSTIPEYNWQCDTVGSDGVDWVWVARAYPAGGTPPCAPPSERERRSALDQIAANARVIAEHVSRVEIEDGKMKVDGHVVAADCRPAANLDAILDSCREDAVKAGPDAIRSTGYKYGGLL